VSCGIGAVVRERACFMRIWLRVQPNAHDMQSLRRLELTNQGMAARWRVRNWRQRRRDFPVPLEETCDACTVAEFSPAALGRGRLHWPLRRAGRVRKYKEQARFAPLFIVSRRAAAAP